MDELHSSFLVPPECDEFGTEIALLRCEDARIQPISIEWQHDKCNQLNLPFSEPIEQHHILIGKPLGEFQPWQTCKIRGDGNCYFRCLSKMITGSEAHYVNLRNELGCYMVFEGSEKLKDFSR